MVDILKLQKILEYLKAITSDANIKLIADPVSSKENGVISLIISETLQLIGYLLCPFS